MGTLTSITGDMVLDAKKKFRAVRERHSAWIDNHLDEMVQVIADAPDGDAARREIMAFCKRSPFDGEMKQAGKLVDILRWKA